MFERFTDRARRVVVLAQEAARLLQHDYVGPEHLLLAMTREGDDITQGIARTALAAYDVDAHYVYHRIVAISGTGLQEVTGHILFTPRAKKVFDDSLKAALQLGHNYIATEHLLLGLCRYREDETLDTGNIAQRIIKGKIDLAHVEGKVIDLINELPERTRSSAEPQQVDLDAPVTPSQAGNLGTPISEVTTSLNTEAAAAEDYQRALAEDAERMRANLAEHAQQQAEEAELAQQLADAERLERNPEAKHLNPEDVTIPELLDGLAASVAHIIDRARKVIDPDADQAAGEKESEAHGRAHAEMHRVRNQISDLRQVAESIRTQQEAALQFTEQFVEYVRALEASIEDQP